MVYSNEPLKILASNAIQQILYNIEKFINAYGRTPNAVFLPLKWKRIISVCGLKVIITINKNCYYKVCLVNEDFKEIEKCSGGRKEIKNG